MEEKREQKVLRKEEEERQQDKKEKEDERKRRTELNEQIEKEINMKEMTIEGRTKGNQKNRKIKGNRKRKRP